MLQDFYKYQAQTTPHPLGLEIAKARGSYIYDAGGKAYLDFIAGVSACTLGHGHPKVVNAIKKQVDDYMHVMVYGEFALKPAVEYTKYLASLLPKTLSTTYLVNSGTEAVEGALKLAKRVTGRSQVIAAKKAYHGNTMGSMSVLGMEEQKRAYRPLIPGVKFIAFNEENDLEKITHKTAAVILETIQGGAGFIVPENNYLKKVKRRCEEVGSLLILDEIQPGFGRTGELFAFQKYGIIPDILVIGKGMAGGMPSGAFVASKKYMMQLQQQPKLGHITTFGGHPVIAAAALATLKELNSSGLMTAVTKKEKLFRSILKHPLIEEVRGEGLMLAIVLKSKEIVDQLILKSLENGLLLFWLLFEPKAARITPPLTISEEEINKGCKLIISILDSLQDNVN